MVMLIMHPVIVLLSFLYIAAEIDAAPMHGHATVPAADQCDWTESGGSGRGVRPVYLRCTRGTVSWRYPRGALRVVLSGGGDGRNFRGCIKVSGPARVYLEGQGTLRLIYAPGDGKHEALHRCFPSKKQLAALYVEADKPTPGRGTVKLRYDLEFENVDENGKIVRRDEESECRPCTKEELAETYCKSDLVARGTVSAVARRPDLDAAELVLRVTKTLRRVEETEDNEVDSGDLRLQREVRVRVPTACDARHGQGEFVIMAKKRLGDLTLACAPRLEAWAEAVQELQSAPCLLRS
ncbi:hypothetical protein PV327_002710 [Microctonus hyperodae]|uniref:Meteorin-like protein n=1 Tax=Microctonus hyperodae TaxID=165561 RepID=A0AA39KPH4_MICHY|nr:hypothetical protein PV327_002710 [Microctonus hyperodae]